jgi:hypothetical protein
VPQGHLVGVGVPCGLLWTRALHLAQEACVRYVSMASGKPQSHWIRFGIFVAMISEVLLRNEDHGVAVLFEEE